MTPEDIQRELDRLWSKVTSAPPPVAPAMPLPPDPDRYSLHEAPAIVREATLETMGLIKKQHREEVDRLSQLIALKERSLHETAERLSQAALELDRLRRREARHEETVYQQVFQVGAELEAARQAQQAAEGRLREEEERLRAVAEETRRRLAAEDARHRELEAGWTEREHEYLLRLRELEGRLQKTREEAAAAHGAEGRSLAELEEAKKAVESSLGQLLEERRERAEAEKERERALARVKDVEERMNEVSNLWTEERRQWQELWDRERSSWDSKRQEMAAWEAKVREEKAAFHAKFGELEARETKHAETMAEVLRRSSDAGERMGDFMRQVAAKAAELAQMRPPPPAEAPRRPRVDRRWLAGAALAAVLAAAVVPVWRHFHRLAFTLTASHELKAARPTAIGYDGDSLWVAQWDGKVSRFDAQTPGEATHDFAVAAKPPYHPGALSIWAGKMYTLDTAQSRLVRQPMESPDKVESEWPAPGQAPAALAHDGQNLWSYDAATKLLYRHLGEGAEAQTEQFRIAADVVPAALRWHKDELWAWDAKGRQVVVLKLKGRVFELAQAAPLGVGPQPPSVQSLLLTYRADEKRVQHLELWTLTTEPGGEPVLRKYLVRR